MIVAHVGQLERLLDMTPEINQAHAAVTLGAISKMILTLGGREGGSLATEAKGEAYTTALEDLPCWAVQCAANRWYRGEWGSSYDYRWMPDPATMRKLATLERARLTGTIRQLNELVAAKPPRVFSEVHMASMRERISKVIGALN